MKDKDIVYHYCGVDSFISIIEKSSLWLSDILKSNDEKEYNWIKEKINANVELDLEKYGEDVLKGWKNWIQRSVIDFGLMTIYAACFSECEDSLSQWRGYAQDGQGLAIGFSKSVLISLNPFKGNPYTAFKLGEVFYDEKNQSDFINSVTKLIFNKFQHEGVGIAALDVDSDYSREFPFYKNPSFKEEKEWRLIMALGNNSKKIVRKNASFSEICYRSCDGRIISYVAMDFSKVKNIIKEVWIGPKSKVTQGDVKNLLYKYEYYDKEKEVSINKPIRITLSESSYR